MKRYSNKEVTWLSETVEKNKQRWKRQGQRLDMARQKDQCSKVLTLKMNE